MVIVHTQNSNLSHHRLPEGLRACAHNETTPTPDRLPVRHRRRHRRRPRRRLQRRRRRKSTTVKHKVSGRVQGVHVAVIRCRRRRHRHRHNRRRHRLLPPPPFSRPLHPRHGLAASRDPIQIPQQVSAACQTLIVVLLVVSFRPAGTWYAIRPSFTRRVTCTPADDDVLMTGCHANRPARRRRRRRCRVQTRPTKWKCTSCYRYVHNIIITSYTTVSVAYIISLTHIIKRIYTAVAYLEFYFGEG